MKKTARLLAMVMIISTIFANFSFAAEQGSTAGIVATQSTALNIRSGPGTGYSVIGKLQKGSYITLQNYSNGWWRIEYADGKEGYVSGDYINEIKESKAYLVNTQSTRLNVRKGPGTNYDIIGKLNKGDYVVVLSIANGWAKVLFDGTKQGYVSFDYLAQNSTVKSNKYPAISLNINRMAQGDIRWANVKIGVSGKTIGSIGCLTTVVAMAESYRQGKTITPDVMSRNLRYTSSGAMYWPSNYINSYTSNYLSEIYNLLKQGKPVLVGAKTYSGGQHWVLVTGFKGGDSLSASNFTIADPGTANRSTLSEFFAAYPVYYKIAYYA
ncbi:MAG: SH3 domain-containing protein [Clostridiaceae bacterium]|nr:SH3 domain-containing protein [Clostridiaceae bacterium]